MSINRQELDKLSNLAKLDIPAQQIETISTSLNDILTMIEQIQAADTASVKPLANPLDAEQVLRQDTITQSNQRDELLALAPDTQQHLLLVPKIIE